MGTATVIRRALAAVLLCAAAGTGTAQAAGPGETFLVGGLPLPEGAIAGGAAGAGEPERGALSADGRFVAFVSQADALSPEADLELANVFRKDRLTGAVVLVSRADGVGGAPAARSGRRVTISADGSRVGWVTDAALDPGDGDELGDVYVRDVATGDTLLATGGVAGDVSDYDLSGDGAHIAFTTAARLVAGDGNGVDDVYLRELASATTRLISAVDGGATAGDGPADSPSLDDDGELVAFASEARNLIAGYMPGGGASNVFLRDVGASDTTLVSHALAAPTRGGNGSSSEPDLARGAASAATAAVAWSSRASDLAAVDNSSVDTIFRRVSGVTIVISRADGPAGANADELAYGASISDDGGRVAFASPAANLGDPAGVYGAYVRDVATGRTSALSSGSQYGVETAISGDGGYATWFSQDGAPFGLDPDLAQVVGRSYAPPPAAPGAVELLSRPAGDAPFLAPAFLVAEHSGGQTISADGRYVVLSGRSGRLEGGPNQQIYRRDTLTGALDLVSRADGPGGAALAGGAYDATISGDGGRVAFVTDAAIDPADGGEDSDVYVRDLAAGTTTLASRADGPAGAPGDRGSVDARIAADGRHVAFVSGATNFGVAGGRRHVWVRDLADGRTTLVDRADGDGAAGNRDADDPAISGDGRLVAYTTQANNLDPADPAPEIVGDVYVRDLASGDTQLVSRRSGADGAKGAQLSFDPAISGDGRLVAFTAYDPALAPEAGPWPANSNQIVARDLLTQQTTLVSRAAGGAVADSYAAEASVDGGGDLVAFTSPATNLLPGHGGETRSSVFVRRLSSGEVSGPPPFGRPGNEPQTRAHSPALSRDGQCLSFTGLGHTGANGAAGDIETGYVHVLSGSCPKPEPKGGPPITDPPRTPPPGEPPRRAVPIAAEVPRVTNLSLLRRRFRVGRAATAVSAQRRGGRRARRGRPTPAGTAVRFTLNARANITIAFERSARGRKVGRQCRRATPRLRRRRACTRWVAAGALVRRGVDGGRRSIAFSGRLGRRALAAGSYRATVTAANAAGRSRAVSVRFTVVRR